MLFLLQSGNQLFFLLRGHPTKDGVGGCGFPQCFRCGQGGSIDVAFAPRDTGLLGNLADGSGIVTGDDLHRYPLLGKIGKGFFGIGPKLAGEENQGNGGDQAAVQLPHFQGSAILGAQQYPVALLSPAGNAPGILPVTQQEFRRADHNVSGIGKRTAIPLGFRGEGNPFGAVQTAFPGEELAHGLCGGVVRFHLAIHGGEDILQLFRQKIPQGDQVFHHHIRLCDGAGFIHAQHIHPGQGFDAVHILHQYLSPAELLGGYRQGNAGEQIQSFGNHADEGGDGSFRTGLEPQLQNPVLLVEKDAAHGNQGNAQEENQAIQRADHFRFLPSWVLFGLLGQGGCAAVCTYGGELHPPPSGEHKAAGMDEVAGVLFHAVLFTGEKRLVYIKLTGAENAVGADLVALTEFGDVIPDNAVGLCAEHFTAPDDLYRTPGYQAELFHGSLGADFLDNANDGIDYHHAQKAHVLHGGMAQQQQHRQHDKHQIEEGQAVPQDDFFFTGSAAGIAAAVQADIQPFLNLGLGQALLGIRVEYFYFFGHTISSLSEFGKSCFPPPEHQKCALFYGNGGLFFGEMIADAQGKAGGKRSLFQFVEKPPDGNTLGFRPNAENGNIPGMVWAKVNFSVFHYGGAEGQSNQHPPGTVLGEVF